MITLTENDAPPEKKWQDIRVQLTAFEVVDQTEVVANPSVVHELASAAFQKQFVQLKMQRPATIPEDLWESWRGHDPLRRGPKDSAPTVLNVCAHVSGSV